LKAGTNEQVGLLEFRKAASTKHSKSRDKGLETKADIVRGQCRDETEALRDRDSQ